MSTTIFCSIDPFLDMGLSFLSRLFSFMSNLSCAVPSPGVVEPCLVDGRCKMPLSLWGILLGRPTLLMLDPYEEALLVLVDDVICQISVRGAVPGRGIRRRWMTSLTRIGGQERLWVLEQWSNDSASDETILLSGIIKRNDEYGVQRDLNRKWFPRITRWIFVLSHRYPAQTTSNNKQTKLNWGAGKVPVVYKMLKP